MGHQVNFYVNPSDAIALERSIRALGPLQILHSRSPGPEPRVVDSVDVEENGRPWLFFYFIRPVDLHAVVTRDVPAQGHWTIDALKSPVVEFTRSFFDGAILRRGRLYYVDGFYDASNQWQEKAESFRTWAKAVLAKSKKELNKHQTDYIGAGAQAWLTSGGKLAT